MGAVVCDDKVFAIGGHDKNAQSLDTTESIQVSSMLETMETCMTRQNKSQWTKLQCQLSSRQYMCATAVVHNCYVVILCGHNGIHCLS